MLVVNIGLIAMGSALSLSGNAIESDTPRAQVVVMSHKVYPSEVVARVEARCPHGRIEFAYSLQKYKGKPRVRALRVDGKSLARDQIARVEALLGTRDILAASPLDCGDSPSRHSYSVIIEFDSVPDTTKRQLASFVVAGRRVTRTHSE